MSLVEVGSAVVEKCEDVAIGAGIVVVVDFDGAGESNVGSNSVA